MCFAIEIYGEDFDMPQEKPHLHTGHRGRVRNKFITNAFEGFAEHEILEMMLFYAVPYVDTNPLSHRLIDRFGSLLNVIDAPRDEIVKIDGAGNNVAALLGVISDIMHKTEKPNVRILLDSTENLHAYYRKKYSNRKDFFVAYTTLDNSCAVINERDFSDTKITSPSFDVRKMISDIILDHASTVVICINHLSGIAFPTVDELACISEINDVLENAGIDLLDFMLISDNDITSVCKD